MNYFWLTYITILGCIIGSFLNVCIYRIPLHLNIAKGRSFCPSCKKTLKPYDMIPVFSYLILGGRCRNCKTRIPVQYPAVEALTGFLFLLAFLVHGFHVQSALLCLFFCCLIVISYIDSQTMTIPDVLVIAVAALGVLQVLTDFSAWPLYLIGAVAVSVPLLLITVFTNGFGGGDIKLTAAAGLFLGWKLVLFGTFLGCLLAAVWSIFLILRKKAGKKTMISFGPFLCMGFLVSALWGSQILNWYLSLLGI